MRRRSWRAPARLQLMAATRAGCAPPASLLLLALGLPQCTSEAYLGAAPSGPTALSSPPSAATRDAAPVDTSAPPITGAARDGSTEPIATVSSDAAVVVDATMAAPGGEAVCVQQGAFEAAPIAGLFGYASVPMPWQGCLALLDATLSAPEIVNETTLVEVTNNMPTYTLPKASEGATYVYMDTQSGSGGQTLATPVCAPLQAGHSYRFAIDLATRVGVDNGVTLLPGKLAVYAPATDICTFADPPLWLSPPLTAAWTPYCVTFTPASDAGYLALRLPGDPAGRSTLLIDHIRNEPGCGEP